MSNQLTRNGVRYITVTAMLSAVAYVLMFIDFPIPFLIPSFIQMDISEFPALIGAFSKTRNFISSRALRASLT